MNKVVATLLGIILVLAIAGASFYGGMLYGKSQSQSTVAAQGLSFAPEDPTGASGGALGQGTRGFGVPGAGGRVPRGEFSQGAAAGSNMLVGTIKEIGDGVLVLSANDGSETTVKVTDTTLIEKNASVELADLEAGETLMISGSTAADGSVTARSIQVAPQGRFGPAMPGAGAPASGADQQTPASGASAPTPTPAK
jgi:hypothetical protein